MEALTLIRSIRATPISCRKHPHHIENTGSGTLHILIFFSRSAPQDIGYRAAAAGYSRSVIASQLGLSEQALLPLPVDIDDPLIVARL